tara:strand:- start:601 stop:762 length:162 start_codon:yes stop_codon:yes gene_type:complete
MSAMTTGASYHGEGLSQLDVSQSFAGHYSAHFPAMLNYKSMGQVFMSFVYRVW